MMRWARVPAGLLVIGLASGGCAPSAKDASHAAADSTAAATSAAESTGADTTASTRTRRSDSLLSVTTQSKVIAPHIPRDSILGRDSAFGPIGTIDSKGKLVPIKKP